MKKELIKIREFRRRRWGENGTPPCSQAIRNYIRNGQLPGEQIGKLWYIDWAAYTKSNGNDLNRHGIERSCMMVPRPRNKFAADPCSKPVPGRPARDLSLPSPHRRQVVPVRYRPGKSC